MSTLKCSMHTAHRHELQALDYIDSWWLGRWYFSKLSLGMARWVCFPPYPINIEMTTNELGTRCRCGYYQTKVRSNLVYTRYIPTDSLHRVSRSSDSTNSGKTGHTADFMAIGLRRRSCASILLRASTLCATCCHTPGRNYLKASYDPVLTTIAANHPAM